MLPHFPESEAPRPLLSTGVTQYVWRSTTWPSDFPLSLTSWARLAKSPMAQSPMPQWPNGPMPQSSMPNAPMTADNNTGRLTGFRLFFCSWQLIKVIFAVKERSGIVIFKTSWQTWYLSRAPRAVPVEKNLSCGEICPHDRFSRGQILNMRKVKKICNVET